MRTDQDESEAGQGTFDLAGSPSDQRFVEAVVALNARFERLDRVASRVETIAEDVAHLKRELRYRRRDLRGATKRRHAMIFA
jgi:hypothetical protein